MSWQHTAHCKPPTPLTALFKQFSAARFWLVWLMLGGLRVLSYLPMPFVYYLGAASGEIAYYLHSSRRAITWRNLTACFPHKKKSEIREMAKHHFRILAAAAFTTGLGWWGSKARLMRLTRFRNREILEDAQKRGGNIILLAPHFVGLEYCAIYLSAITPTVTMYQRHKNPLLSTLIKQHRARFGLIQYARKNFGASMIKLIRDGCLFYYLPDQDPGSNKGVFAPFYSIPTATFASLGRIARLTEATVIPCVTRILPRGHGYEIIFGQPLINYPANDDAVLAASKMNHAIEGLIEYAPAQYFWSHRRFKTRPPGAPPFY